MQESSSFRLKNLLYSDSDYHVYRAEEIDSGQPFILKFSADHLPTPFTEHKLRREAGILKKVAHNYVIRFLEVVKHENSIALLFEDSDYHPFSAIDLAGGMDMELFLRVAHQIAEVVSFIHSRGYFHKNLNLNNIWYDSNTQSINMGGFSIASKMGREFYRANTKDISYADVNFVSPELTGRTNKVLDYRTDLYSLGVLYYYLLTAQLPFENEDPMEIVHAHLAVTPKSPKKLRPDIPVVVSDIVMRLLNKDAAQRYQSAFGLLADLDQCNKLFHSESGIVDFQPGLQDRSFYFSIPDKLYGRQQELKKLKEAFHNTMKGIGSMLLVSGYSGVGKSRIIHELKSVDYQNLYFASGKFDQLGNDSPMNPVFKALSNLIKQILSESEEELNQWRERFQQNLGGNAAVITEVIPEMELLVGKQENLPELPLVESANRFRSTFDAFLKTFSENNRLVCLFLDDLQWIDSASCQWIENLVSDNQFSQILIIGAYRDNEVDSSHPLKLMADKLSSTGVKFTDIKLEPLQLHDLNVMVAETLGIPTEKCFDLAGLIYEKTHGNPFFTRQCLYKLYDSGAIKFDHDAKIWTYSLSEVSGIEISDNVIELLSQNIKALSTSLQRTLKTASCIGNSFEVLQLNRICKKPVEELLSDLSELEEAGMIRTVEEMEGRKNKHFNFSHDRLQQASYELIDPSERKKLRFEIGEALLDEEDISAANENIYAIADHLNYAEEQVLEREGLSEKLIQINIQASIKAKKSTAYDQALNYILTAESLVDSPETAPSQIPYKDLYLQLAECFHLCGNNQKAEKYYPKALDHCTDSIQRGRIFRSMIHFYSNRQMFEAAYQTGVRAVGELGVKISKKFIPPLFVIDLLKYKWLSKGMKPADFLHLKEMENPRLEMAMLLMATFARAAFQIRPELCVSLAVKMVNLSLKHGNADGVYIGHLAHGTIFHGAIMNQKRKGYEFGQLTLNLIEKYSASEYKAEVLFVVGYFAVPWIDSAETMEGYWSRAYETGLESGDHFHASCACCATVQSKFMRGIDVDEVWSTANNYTPFLERINNEEVLTALLGLRLVMNNLKGMTKSPTSFSSEGTDEKEILDKLRHFSTRHFAHFYFINKMKALYMWGEFEKAYEVSLQSDAYLKDSPGMLHTAEHFLYKGLVICALYQKFSPIQRWARKREVKKILKKFETYSKNNAHNFSHKYFLLKAEFSIIENNFKQAEIFYNKADAASRQYVYNDILAIANLRAFQFYNSQQREKIASLHFRDAYYFLRKVGASGIEEEFIAKNEKYKNLVNSYSEVSSGSFASSVNPKTVDGDRLDLMTILKSSEAISSQIKLSDLIASLLRIIVENAGAERVVLMLRIKGKLRVIAEKVVSEENHRETNNMRFEKFTTIPHSLVNYVMRSKEAIVLDRATESDRFSRDQYLKNNNVKSVMCIPLTLKGEVTGILYLENNLSDTVFTRERVELLNLLTGQMAISLENSQLYENLEEKVEERTKELLHEKQKSDELLMNILPADTAEELKKTGTARAKEFKLATILFTDFIDFTKISEDLDAQELVNQINYYYSNFDRIIQKYEIEKIKTIGDSYMCAGGLPVKNLANPVDTVKAALELRDFVEKEKEIRKKEGRLYFELRIGINTGPVIAGIVGIKKFAYDIWGDAVNIAARMETNGAAGKINISHTTYKEVKDHFVCRYRGKIEAKNKGKIDMYFVEGIKELLTEH